MVWMIGEWYMEEVRSGMGECLLGKLFQSKAVQLTRSKYNCKGSEADWGDFSYSTVFLQNKFCPCSYYANLAEKDC